MSKKTAIIIGAGPAGLTAAYELAHRAGTRPIVIEQSECLGGLARTVNYKGNRIDIGGHRFFSKSDRVMQWWTHILPIQRLPGRETSITYQQKSRIVSDTETGPDPDREDRVMLIRQRKSRVYFMRKFFDYPIRLSVDTLSKLGIGRSIRIGFSYLKSLIRPLKEEKTFEQFLINRFGRELYLTFFKSYTEKVWGVPCRQISAEWGAQRIKGLSISKALLHFIRNLFSKSSDIAQKKVETSLIEQFLYPKYGPGQMWEEVADRIKEKGGEVHTGYRVDKIHQDGNRIKSIEATQLDTGEKRYFEGDYFFSTMAVKDLVRALDCPLPDSVKEVSEGLLYRDFITVGLLLNRLKVKPEKKESRDSLIRDNWIYIQEPDVLVGRLQLFNNWSPYMISDPSKVWVGLEYFCYETDDLWKKNDPEMIQLAAEELERIGIIDKADVLDATVIHMPKTYPAYFGTYDRFQVIQNYLDPFENLFLIGRNGMHKYNNQDHSMLTAIVAVDNIIEGRTDKSNIWAVNTEQEYHEEK